ncbi:hypothetical protein D0466_18875 [Peribacillus glennii]|uniref:Uncharacterized protein n=1 Tax=Peribacillus glennii TaxID=2303991 RepID=A0A372L7N6_9BACI|nr:hypothetical protein D0466_18875 [Peribacillus glennii]
MYFGWATALNSCVVGEDNNRWLKEHPFPHDYPGSVISLTGEDFKTKNYLAPRDQALTVAFSPFGVSTFQGECVKVITKASESILR